MGCMSLPLGVTSREEARRLPKVLDFGRLAFGGVLAGHGDDRSDCSVDGKEMEE